MQTRKADSLCGLSAKATVVTNQVNFTA